MTQILRFRLTEQFVAFLDAGRPDLTAPILEAAALDPELARLLGDVSLGMAEDDGFAVEPGDADRTRSLLSQAAAAATASTAGTLGASRGDGSAHPYPFMTLAVDNTGRRPSEIARELGTTVEFIDDVNDYPDVAGRAVVLRLVDLAGERLSMNRGMSLYALDRNPPRKAMAASRDTAPDMTPPTFDEIVERSQMDTETADGWRALHAADGALS